MSSKKRKYRETFSSSFGGALVDFDELIRRATPQQSPELVHAGEDVRGLAGPGEAEGEADIPPADDDRRPASEAGQPA